jgi:hypothetical protein
MARSIRQFISDTKIDLRDVSGSQNVWTFDEYYSSFQAAFRKAKGYFTVPDVHTSIVLGTGQREYFLPPYVTGIRAIDYAIGAVVDSSITSWRPLRAYRHLQAQDTNYLHVDGDFPNAATRIYYERDLTVPPVEVTSGTLVNSTQSFIPVRIVNPTGTTGYPIAEWTALVPFHVQLDNEIMRVDSVALTGFAEVRRGMFGTSPLVNSLSYGIGFAHDTPGALSPYIAYDHADEFLYAQAKRELALYRMNDAETEANRNLATLAGEWQREADQAKQRYSPRKIPRVFTQRLTDRR